MTFPNRPPQQQPSLPGEDAPPPYVVDPEQYGRVWRPAEPPPYEIPGDLPRYEFLDHTEPLPEWASPPADQPPFVPPPPPYPNLNNAVQEIEPIDEPNPVEYAADIRCHAAYFDNPEPSEFARQPGLVQRLEEQAGDEEENAREYSQALRANQLAAQHQTVGRHNQDLAEHYAAAAESHQAMAALHVARARIEPEQYSTLAQRYQAMHSKYETLQNEYQNMADHCGARTPQRQLIDRLASYCGSTGQETQTLAEKYRNKAQRLREKGSSSWWSHRNWADEHRRQAADSRTNAQHHEGWRETFAPDLQDPEHHQQLLGDAENFERLHRTALDRAERLRREAQDLRHFVQGYRAMADGYQGLAAQPGGATRPEGLSEESRTRIVEHNRKRRILQLRKDGMSVEEIARVLRIDQDVVRRVLNEGPVSEGPARWPGRRSDDDGAGGAGAGAGAGGADARGAGPAWGGSHYGPGALGGLGGVTESGAGAGRSAAGSHTVMYEYDAMQHGVQQLQQVHAQAHNTLDKVLATQKQLGHGAAGAGADAIRYRLGKLVHANQSILDVLGLASTSLRKNTGDMQHIEARLAALFDAGA